MSFFPQPGEYSRATPDHDEARLQRLREHIKAAMERQRPTHDRPLVVDVEDWPGHDINRVLGELNGLGWAARPSAMVGGRRTIQIQPPQPAETAPVLPTPGQAAQMVSDKANPHVVRLLQQVMGQMGQPPGANGERCVFIYGIPEAAVQEVRRQLEAQGWGTRTDSGLRDANLYFWPRS